MKDWPRPHPPLPALQNLQPAKETAACKSEGKRAVFLQPQRHRSELWARSVLWTDTAASFRQTTSSSGGTSMLMLCFKSL